MNFRPSVQYSYVQKRKCQNCSTPIADQEHASTKFCARIEMSDGTIQSCKDDYHSSKRREKNSPYKKIADYHKAVHKSLKSMWNVSKDVITFEQLNLYKINLRRPVAFDVDPHKVTTYYFVEFAITQSINNQLKIFKHGRDF